ncbi:hypothetical protein PFISCL1PPCAC_24592 [Pristionchus fissidentatus]|uniref:Carboxylic ester hydrolase n=1 Tax=Pristionchus fissidentatus TaxID=1538716 RepID=A0AAV5WRR4_9BILA|nr:hypothetical protein PFISCL1PPCAC_24592 [Pristionchus fissidentatus]
MSCRRISHCMVCLTRDDCKRFPQSNRFPKHISDCLESFRYVRNEIHNFGGDKEKITLMGHSTGADMALLIAFSPGINIPDEPSIFPQVILMSSCGVFEHEERQVKRSHSMAAAMGCKGSAQEIIDCLMPLSTEKILELAELHESPNKYNPFSDTHVSNIVYAGELLPVRNIQELWKNQKPIKLMLGTIMNEFNL